MENNNDYAFPVMTDDYEQKGITMLDYFAAKAMQGIMSAPPDSISQDLGPNARSGSGGSINYAAEVSYRVAFAMMEARKQYL